MTGSLVEDEVGGLAIPADDPEEHALLLGSFSYHSKHLDYTLLFEFELLSPDVWAVKGLLALLAPVAQVDTLGRFLPALWFWPGKTTVSLHDLPEPPLTPF